MLNLIIIKWILQSLKLYIIIYIISKVIEPIQ
jgi:hypothetical protein